MTRVLCILAFLAALPLVVSACLLHQPMSPQRSNCLNDCASENDRCVLEAHTGAALQGCDAQMRNCAAICPAN